VVNEKNRTWVQINADGKSQSYLLTKDTKFDWKNSNKVKIWKHSCNSTIPSATGDMAIKALDRGYSFELEFFSSENAKVAQNLLEI
jgi:hypothetical protein